MYVNKLIALHKVDILIMCTHTQYNKQYNNNTTCVTCGTGTVYPSGTPGFILGS